MNYYSEIENYIKKNEVNKRARILEENLDVLNNYWQIGRILVLAQGGEKRAKYWKWSYSGSDQSSIQKSMEKVMMLQI